MMTLEVVDEWMITLRRSSQTDVVAVSGAFQMGVRLEQHVQVASLEDTLLKLSRKWFRRGSVESTESEGM